MSKCSICPLLTPHKMEDSAFGGSDGAMIIGMAGGNALQTIPPASVPRRGIEPQGTG
jgi:hypothetical protein